MKIFANIFLFFYFMILALGFNNISISKDFYAISFNSIEGDKIFLSNYKNKVILVVNTASFCGFTGQFKGIQNIWEKYKSDGLIVIGVPSNDFGQEAKTNSEVKNFCSMNFDVDFVMTETSKIRGENAHPLFKYLKTSLGLRSTPKWNFYKYIINKNGKPITYFSSIISPENPKLIIAIEESLYN